MKRQLLLTLSCLLLLAGWMSAFLLKSIPQGSDLYFFLPTLLLVTLGTWALLLDGVRDAVGFIADLRQASDLASLPVGRRVVVIGGGMTAIDAAVQSKLLGAEEVTLVYRRSRDEMPASRYEQDLAASKGVVLRFNAKPVAIEGGAHAEAVVFERTESGPDGLTGTGETFRIEADQVLRAIGQTLDAGPLAGLSMEGRKIAVDAEGRTSMPKVWAGGDCTAPGDDLTVTAVAQGRDAAMSIHRALSGA